MGRQSCGDCRKLEKHTYWTRFQSVHFFAVLRSDFHLKLRIPQEFVENLERELPRIMSLKGPSGHDWDIGVTGDGNDLRLETGWPEFVKDHGLKRDDVLFFEYKGGSELEVLMFDQTSCEKVNCYFVTKCRGCCHHSRKRARETPVAPSSSRKKVKEPAGKGGQSNRMKGKSVSTPLVELKVEKGSEFDGYEMPDVLSSYRLHFLSKRRPVSEEEIARTYELANEAADAVSEPNFLVSMQSTHVSCRFDLGVPVGIMREENNSLPSEDEDIVLVVEDKTWTARYTIRNYGKGAAITGDGWADFVFDNNIEKHDVCLFQPSHEKDTYFIKVRIFRVVEPVAPLLKATREMLRAANIGLK